MKDQYFGDVNDYRKYGLLRVLTTTSGLPLGVCWLRTANDSSRDGEFRGYLDDHARFRHHDPELFDSLRGLTVPECHRSVSRAQEWGILRGATYHDRLLADKAIDRQAYFAEAWERLAASPLIFFDPDNGIEVKSISLGRKGSSKFIYWTELEETARRGHSVLVYQHFRREARDGFIARMGNTLRERLGAGSVTVYRTAHVAFFLAARPEHVNLLDPAREIVSQRWGSQITVSRLPKVPGRSRTKATVFRPLGLAEKTWIAGFIHRLIPTAADPKHPMSRVATNQISLTMWRWTADGINEDGVAVPDGIKYNTNFLPATRAALEAAGRNDGKVLRHEHVVPRSVLTREIIQARPSISEILVLLEKHCRAVIVTVEEDRRLSRSTMPADWSWTTGEVFARYVEAQLHGSIVPPVVTSRNDAAEIPDHQCD